MATLITFGVITIGILLITVITTLTLIILITGIMQITFPEETITDILIQEIEIPTLEHLILWVETIILTPKVRIQEIHQDNKEVPTQIKKQNQQTHITINQVKAIIPDQQQPEAHVLITKVNLVEHQLIHEEGGKTYENI